MRMAQSGASNKLVPNFRAKKPIQDRALQERPAQPEICCALQLMRASGFCGSNEFSDAVHLISSAPRGK